MKHSLIVQLTSFLIFILVLYSCKESEPIPDHVVQRQDTMTIASLRQFQDHTIPSSIRITDAGREGTFNLVMSDMTTADNMGTVLVMANGRRYKRSYMGPASAFWFGIEPANADIGPKLQIAVDAADELIIPDGKYTQLTTVHLRSGMSVRGNPGKVMITLPKTYVSFANATDPTIPLNSVLIDGLSWTVTSQEKGTYGVIYIDGPSVTNLTVQNCTSTDAAAKDSTNWMTLKIQTDRVASNIVVKNNSVEAKRMGCEIFNHDNPSIYAGKAIEVSNNYFHDCHFGISLSGPLDGLTVSDNHVKDCSLFGIEIAGAARNVTITNNKFEGVFDKFLEGSNDGNGNGSVTGGMLISGNTTVGLCTGGVQLFNGGAVNFTKNKFIMSGMLEIGHSTKGGMFTDNVLESAANKAVICDNSPNNTFSGNQISNEASTGNQATFMSYGSKAIDNLLTNNRIGKGPGGKYYEGVQGGTVNASANYDNKGNLLP